MLCTLDECVCIACFVEFVLGLTEVGADTCIYKKSLKVIAPQLDFLHFCSRHLWDFHMLCHNFIKIKSLFAFIYDDCCFFVFLLFPRRKLRPHT